jgi:hypothetical protein
MEDFADTARCLQQRHDDPVEVRGGSGEETAFIIGSVESPVARNFSFELNRGFRSDLERGSFDAVLPNSPIENLAEQAEILIDANRRQTGSFAVIPIGLDFQYGHSTGGLVPHRNRLAVPGERERRDLLQPIRIVPRAGELVTISAGPQIGEVPERQRRHCGGRSLWGD